MVSFGGRLFVGLVEPFWCGHARDLRELVTSSHVVNTQAMLRAILGRLQVSGFLHGVQTQAYTSTYIEPTMLHTYTHARLFFAITM